MDHTIRYPGLNDHYLLLPTVITPVFQETLI